MNTLWVVKRLSQEIFTQVVDAESKASEIIQQAQHQAREMLKTAQADCLKAERDQASEQRALYQSILDAARTRIQDELDAGREARVKALDDQMQSAEAKLGSASALIVERIISDGHC